jgi:phosphoribosylformylglycinamidine cyclo-ligase
MAGRDAYAKAGVNTAAGDRAVELMKSAVSATHGPNILGGVGGFAGLFDGAFLKDFRHPILATSTDGVGTKIAIAQALNIHDTIGQDLVGMVVDDIVVVGAKPLFMTDYIACGKVIPERIADIVRGIAEACAATGTALVGGETAEHPGVMGDDDYDLAGAAVGVVEADELLGPDRVEHGDVVIALASSGLHSNGYSLVRHILTSTNRTYEQSVPEFDRALGLELLEPTRLYTGVLLDSLAAHPGVIHALSHVTGGGIAANLARTGFRVARRTETHTGPAPDILLLDTTGELPDWYACADVVFIGKSLRGSGGQNPVEAILAGRPVLFGPQMQNFAALREALLSAGGAVEIHDANDLAAETVRLFTDPSHRAKLVENAGIALQPHHGATVRTAGLVENAVMGSDSAPSRV